MGCDIHLQAEVFIEDPEDRTKGKWVHVPNPIRECDMCNGTGKRLEYWNRAVEPPVRYDPPLVLDADCWWCVERNPDLVDPAEDEDGWRREYYAEVYVPEVGKVREEWYHDRNYDVFALLANVRNGDGGWAMDGDAYGDQWTPIAMPRGVPRDCSPEVAKYMAEYDHTPSYLYLDEITRYDWDGSSIIERGWVDVNEYRAYLATGRPDGYCSGVGGGGVRLVSNAEMDRVVAAIDKGEEIEPYAYYTMVEWKKTARESCGRFLDAMKELATLCGEHRARIVFYFDS